MIEKAHLVLGLHIDRRGERLNLNCESFPTCLLEFFVGNTQYKINDDDA